MTRMNISEFELIRRIVKQIPKGLREPALLRDDTAVLNLTSKRGFQRLMTTDALVEDVDFLMSKARPEDIGKKALGVNLSDIAAMGGRPDCFTIALGIPPYVDEAWVKRFYDGVLFWARRFKVVCAGGDISKAPYFFSSITVLGQSRRAPILRCGAQEGDWIGVTGQLGGSLKGRHLIFKPRIEEGAFLADKSIHAMIDISDGLMQDLNHILTQSNAGCEIELTAIPLSREAAAQNRDRTPDNALKSALTDGEDFELLFTASPSVRKKIDAVWKKRFPGTRLSWIGRVTKPGRDWVWLRKGLPCEPLKINQKGYQHFK